MAFGNIVNKAKRKLDERGGTEALKQDAQQLKDIAKGKGTMSEKAKRAQQAVKEPGGGAAPGGAPSGQSAPQQGPATPTAGPTGVGNTGATPGDGGTSGPTATDLPDSQQQAGSEGRSSGSSGPQSPA